MARIFRLGDGVSTDAIMPGRYNVTTDISVLGQYCLVEHRPDFAATVQRGDIIVAGSNFGCGSSREHAPLAIQATGVAAVVAVTFARIFYRNAVNIGLPVIACADLWPAVQDGDEATIDILSGTITTGGRTFQGERPGAVARRIMEAGTLVDLIKTHGWEAVEEEARA